MMSSPIVVLTVNSTVIGHIDGKPLAEILNSPESFIELSASRVVNGSVERIEDLKQLADSAEYSSIQVNKANIVVAIEL
jgi:hypothetical protein